MTTLRVEELEVYRLGSRQLEEFVRRTYPELKEYAFRHEHPLDGIPEGAHFQFLVEPMLQPEDDEDWCESLEQGHPKCNSLLLDKLCADGHLPPGRCFVEVDW